MEKFGMRIENTVKYSKCFSAHNLKAVGKGENIHSRLCMYVTRDSLTVAAVHNVLDLHNNFFIVPVTLIHAVVVLFIALTYTDQISMCVG